MLPGELQFELVLLYFLPKPLPWQEALLSTCPLRVAPQSSRRKSWQGVSPMYFPNLVFESICACTCRAFSAGGKKEGIRAVALRCCARVSCTSVVRCPRGVWTFGTRGRCAVAKQLSAPSTLARVSHTQGHQQRLNPCCASFLRSHLQDVSASACVSVEVSPKMAHAPATSRFEKL